VAGLDAPNDNLPPGDAAWWSQYRARVEEAAVRAASRWG
jgi:hypothetical protein